MEDTPTTETPRDTFGEATAVEQTKGRKRKSKKTARSNVVEATEACRQAEPELAGMPPQAEEARLAFTADQLDAAGVVYQESDITRCVEINAKAQGALRTISPVGTTGEDIIGAVLSVYGIEGQANINTNEVSKTLLIWQSKKGPAAQAAASGSRKRNLTIEELLALHVQTCESARAIMSAKNADYTNGSVDPFSNFRTAEALGVPAEIGLMVRMLDKMKRVQTFVNKGTLQVKAESAEDSIQDLINYCILLKGIIVSRRLEAGA